MRPLIFLMSIFFIQISLSQEMQNILDSIASPDGKLIAFIKPTKKIIPDRCFSTLNPDDAIEATADPDTGLSTEPDQSENLKYANQIWIYNTKSKKEKLLVDVNFDCDKPERQMVDPGQIKFSPDSRKLYFIATGWVTSGALHVVNIDGTDEHYLIPANSYQFVKNGQYKGDLIVNQHHYRIKGDTPLGSYDWDWLFTPEGKQIQLYKKEN